MNTAPWWGTAIIAGGFAILGLLLGQLGSLLSDRRKVEVEEIRRIQDSTRIVGAKLIGAVLEAREQVKLARAAKGDPDQIKAHLDQHKKLTRGARLSQDELKFIASRPVNDRALAMIKSVDHLNADSTPEAMAAVWPALSAFANAARKEAGLPVLHGERNSTPPTSAT